jgi:pimeloyl-ACP methyl ester carboxylesterase
MIVLFFCINLIKGVSGMPSIQYQNRVLYFEDKGRGTPILFIHPPGMGRKVFFYQCQLAERYRIILPDLSGHGDSQTKHENFSIRDYANEVHAILEYLEIKKAVICGYSSGGIVAQEFASRYSNQVIAMILSGGFPEVKSTLLKFEHLAGMFMLRNYPQLLCRIIAHSHTENKEIRQVLINHMKKADIQIWLQFYQESLHYSCLNDIDKWDFPLLLIYGSRDFINKHIRYYNRGKFEIEIIENAFHQLPMKNWKSFNHIIGSYLQNIKSH